VEKQTSLRSEVSNEGETCSSEEAKSLACEEAHKISCKFGGSEPCFWELQAKQV